MTDYDAGVSVETIVDRQVSGGQLIMPFYFLCDVSSSMSNDMGELNAAIGELIRMIQSDPVIDDLTMLSIIAFNHSAHTVVDLKSPGELVPPTLTSSGGTDYSAAFVEYNRAFQQDRARLTAMGAKMYRPCVFFLTDGAPNDRDYLTKFRSLFGYDPQSQTGNKAFPYFVPFGFRDAPEDVIKSLAYPDFGRTKGRWFVSRSSNVREVLHTMAEALGQTVISSGLSSQSGPAQIVPPTVPAGSDMQFGEAGDTVN